MGQLIFLIDYLQKNIKMLKKTIDKQQKVWYSLDELKRWLVNRGAHR